jgi:hypothetical protein
LGLSGLLNTCFQTACLGTHQCHTGLTAAVYMVSPIGLTSTPLTALPFKNKSNYYFLVVFLSELENWLALLFFKNTKWSFIRTLAHLWINLGKTDTFVRWSLFSQDSIIFPFIGVFFYVLLGTL